MPREPHALICLLCKSLCSIRCITNKLSKPIPTCHANWREWNEDKDCQKSMRFHSSSNKSKLQSPSLTLQRTHVGKPQKPHANTTQCPARGFNPGCRRLHVRHPLSSSHEESLGRTCQVLAAHGALTELLGSLALLAHRVPTRHQSHHVPILVADGAVALGALRCDAGLLRHVRPHVPPCLNENCSFIVICLVAFQAKFSKLILQVLQGFIVGQLWGFDLYLSATLTLPSCLLTSCHELLHGLFMG
mmetsp:Transcript_14658/g.17578  ORF Transcript_14658/g.17578 Transcript_14658/m.17578 type:complete len:246 (-) Transcript_14658:4-741(-)